MNRVVVTGYGVVSPVGNTPEEFWQNIKNGNPGIAPITKFDASETGITLAAEIKDFTYEKHLTKKDMKRMDLFSLYGIYAALEALEMSKLSHEDLDEDRFGVIVGSGIGGLQTIQEQVIRMHDKGPQRVAPLFIPMSIGNMVAGNIALRIGAKGICTSIVTACATGTHSIGEAFRNIKHGYSDVIVCGGSEASITEIGISGFAALKALSTATDPKRASIPFDEERNGFVMGEGSGILVLESLEHAQERGANILAEVVGYGANCDAYHMTAPTPDGTGAAKAIQLALQEAGIEPKDVGYVNAHGTSTQANDSAETKAIRLALGEAADQVLVSSTKSMTGHLLGAAGGVEAIVLLNALLQQFVPPTANCEKQAADCDLNVVPKVGVDHEFTYAISNSLGFGGHNAVLCMKRWEE